MGDARPAGLPSDLRSTDPGTPGPFAQGKKPAAPQPPSPAAFNFPAAPPVARAPPRVTPIPGPVELSPAEQQVIASENSTAAEGEIRARPAPVYARVLAWVVDAGLISALVGTLLTLAAVIIGAGATLGDKLASLSKVALPGLVLAALIAFVYTTLFALLFKGRTPGRLLLGIRLVDGTGQSPKAIRAVIRAGLSLVSFALFLSGFWLALFDRRGQTLHDKLTRTYVVRLVS